MCRRATLLVVILTARAISWPSTRSRRSGGRTRETRGQLAILQLSACRFPIEEQYSRSNL
jgi:hypothetical protein